ncbi:MAG TPA: hypothetical protein VHO50_06845 [Bacteroidales bacterium]|nr:hypothetical protein [Bacteroidales bacterium]
MERRLIIVGIMMLLAMPVCLLAQTRSAFTGDLTKYTQELILFMGPNLDEGQTHNLDAFIARFDSSAFNKEIMVRIADISSQLSSRYMRPVPNFDTFIRTLNFFSEYKQSDDFFTNWLTGLSELAFSPRYTNDNVQMFLRNTALMITDNVLFDSGSVKWKVKDHELKFLHDTIFYIEIKDATLTCYAQKDSTEIFDVSGEYFPEFHLFKGKKGTVTWEKAGYSKEDVFAEINDYTIDISKSGFSVDSARLTHSTYFKKPVLGLLRDQAISFSSVDKATYPRFSTYTTTFLIKDLYQDVDYDGGLTFEGAMVKGSGKNYSPAKISMLRNDTLYLRISSKEFIFSQTGINSNETALSLYLDKDSIYHTNLGFSYFAETRQVNLFRNNNPVSKSPYFNSFHKIDMYFEYLSWNMNESKINLSRSRGASIGQAKFESSAFFNSNSFMRIMGLDEYHPLYRLVKFAEWYYSETFPVAEFAKWLNKPEEAVTGLCIDMANQGFVFFDKTNNEVTIKQKTKDFIDFYAKKKDYDVISINSETKAPEDNATLDLKNYRLTINGVRSVFLSDSQMVALYPKDRKIVLGKNRDLQFDGIIDAGLFTVYGHNFSFSYDSFKIRLQKIDSIKVAYETGERDLNGNRLIKQVNNVIQLGTADLYIDRPDNKSGLKSLKQYPIINAITYSYIFYDKIPGLEGIYPQKDFYFRIDPFTYENIDHYSNQELNLTGQFFGGNILKPSTQHLTIQENNSLGFNMITTDAGVDIYDGRATLYENLSMSNKGLIGSGKINHLTSQTISDEFKLFPDSMLTLGSSFVIHEDGSGVFPELKGADVKIKWDIPGYKWVAENSPGKNFEMFNNGTVMSGSLSMTPKKLYGTGIIDMSESRVTSNLFNFASRAIKADTADYNIKSRTTDGYSFIAENANTDINFDEKMARFRLNTDSSFVKFPEIQYICTMTNFAYNMNTRILNMEQKGKSDTPLLTSEELIRVDRKKLDPPTFFSTNNLTDTIKFSSWKGNYNLDNEIIQAENINYIPVADALIQPSEGRITITRRAQIHQLQKALVAINNRYILHDAKIDIESPKRYSGSAVFDYIDENKDIQQINFAEITVDTLTTNAKGSIPASQKFMLSPAFSFAGDVNLNAKNEFLVYTGSAGIVSDCDKVKTSSIKFKSQLDPQRILIPVSEKPRDKDDNLVFSGSFISADSLIAYPVFLSPLKSWADVGLVNATGYLYYDKAKSSYLISSLEKIADRKAPGNMVVYDKFNCIMTGEGALNFGARYDLVKFASAGNFRHNIDSGNVAVKSVFGIDFHFSPEALVIMADELKLVPTLKPVNINAELVTRGMQDIFGIQTAAKIKEEMSLFGTSRNLPKEYTYELFINDVNLYWNEATSSFRSKGKIGIGFVGAQPLNLYVDGSIEIQRRRSGDMIDIYLKANESTWYYFSYFRGVMMTQAGNNTFNNLISETKANVRKHPDSSVRVPYSYMIAAEDRLSRFLRRIASDASQGADDEASVR